MRTQPKVARCICSAAVCGTSAHRSIEEGRGAFVAANCTHCELNRCRKLQIQNKSRPPRREEGGRNKWGYVSHEGHTDMSPPGHANGSQRSSPFVFLGVGEQQVLFEGREKVLDRRALVWVRFHTQLDDVAQRGGHFLR